MEKQIPGNYLRAYRKKSGLSQRELGLLLGYLDQGQVSRHERSQTEPPLTSALAYESIFRVPVSAIFPGIHSDVKQAIEEKLAKFEVDLNGRSAKDRGAKVIAQKLIWLTKRKTL
jgi:transcriptional regulator with XRE-family HTH domain